MARRGLLALSDLERSVREALATPLAPGHVGRLVTLVPGLTWLNEGHEWLTLATDRFRLLPEPRRDRLMTHLRRVFAVAKELDVVDLRRALARVRGMRWLASVPPPVLLQLCRGIEGLTVTGDRVAAPVQPPEGTLARVEQAIVAALKRRGGSLPRSELLRSVARAAPSVTPENVEIVITLSAVLTSPARGVVGLVGATRDRVSRARGRGRGGEERPERTASPPARARPRPRRAPTVPADVDERTRAVARHLANVLR